MSPRVTDAVEDQREPKGWSGVRFVREKADGREIEGGKREEDVWW